VTTHVERTNSRSAFKDPKALPDRECPAQGQTDPSPLPSKLSNASFAASGTTRFWIIHPFHPKHGREFELQTRREVLGEDRAFYYDKKRRLRSMPIAWASLAKPDLFLELAAGRTPFRVDDLADLARLIDTLEDCQEGDIL